MLSNGELAALGLGSNSFSFVLISLSLESISTYLYQLPLQAVPKPCTLPPSRRTAGYEGVGLVETSWVEN